MEHEEAFKVLERYCRRRYRHTSLQAPPEAVASPASPFPDWPETSQQLSRQGSLSLAPCKPPTWWDRLKSVYHDLGLKYVLVILLMLSFALLGGLMFLTLEADVETARQNIKKYQSRLIRDIAILFSHDSCRVQRRHVISDAYMDGQCRRKLAMMLKEYTGKVKVENCGPDSKWTWDYWNAVFFALSLMTTIGYGNMHCRTLEGRIATICYALIGIPIMLILLNSLGHLLFDSFQNTWELITGVVKSKIRWIRRRLRVWKRTSTMRKGKSMDGLEGQVADEGDSEDDEHGDIFQTFPLALALTIVFLYILMCSAIVRFWESWDWFTAFYFLFISMSTIGLGDEMPDHPHYSSCFFVFFIVGLSLVSMCVTMLQMRVENKYMQALQLIDDQREALDEQDKDKHSERVQMAKSETPTEAVKAFRVRPMSLPAMPTKFPSIVQQILNRRAQMQNP